MQPIQVKEHLDYHDFLEAGFPQAIKPIYKKRLFIINMAFGILFILASFYLFYETYKNGIKFGSMHYFYLFFAVLFPFLAFYMVRKEQKFYTNLVDRINQLETVYTFTDDTISVINKEQNLVYKTDELKNVTELPKWLIFEFNDDSRLAVYKPNISPQDMDILIQKFNS